LDGALRSTAVTHDAVAAVRQFQVLPQGDEGIGFKIAMAGLDGGRLNIAACSLGGAQSALEKALAYMKERRAFGKRLDEFQALQFRLADMATQIAAARGLVLDAAARVASDAIQIHGGYGYVADFPVERIYRDVRVCQIYEGTSDIQRLVIAREIAKD